MIEIHADSRAFVDVGWSLEPPDWTERALCAQVDPELFFPEKGGSARTPKLICAECPVRAECLAFAMERESVICYRHGIYGGLSASERRTLAATGWMPGDEVPPVRVPDDPRRERTVCPECGGGYFRLEQHQIAMHIRGAA